MQLAYSLTTGQSDGCGSCQSSRWHSVTAASKTGEGTLAVGPSLRRNTVCPVHTRGDQSSGRCRIQGDSRSPGLEAIGGNFPEDQCHLGAPVGRSVCHMPYHSTSSVLRGLSKSAFEIQCTSYYTNMHYINSIGHAVLFYYGHAGNYHGTQSHILNPTIHPILLYGTA